MKRRDLVKLLGVAVGGVSLTTCRGSEGTAPSYGPPQLPNGFRFYPVFNSGTALPGGSPFGHFRLDAAIDDRNEIYFSCVDGNGKSGLYALQMDYTGTPRVTSSRKVVRVGDVLTGDRTVLGIDHYDVNPEGGIGVVLTFPHASAAIDGVESTKEVWLDLTKGGLQRTLYEGFVTADGHVLGGMFGDIDVHDGHDVLLVGWYIHVDPQAGQPRPAGAPDDDVIRQGLFVMQGGDPAQTHLELHNEQLTGEDGSTATIGLIDMHDGPAYVIQAHPSRVTQATPAPPAGGAPAQGGGGYLVVGRIGRRGRGLAQLTAPVGAPAGITTLLSSPAVGAAYFGPRMGPNELTAYVLHTGETATTLYHHGLEIIHSGQDSPRGSTVGHILPPVFGNNGEIYYLLMTRDGHELCAANGEEQRTLLARGDRLAGDSRTVNSIMLGHTTDGVDSAGRLVFVTIFDDQTAAVTVGIPT